MIANDIWNAFQKSRNVEIAVGQAAYMRDQFPFLGLKTPVRRALQKDIFLHYTFNDEKVLQKDLLSLWNQKEREFQYVACDLAEKHRKHITDLEFLKVLITTKSWWDTVDGIAACLVGFLLKQDETLLPYMDEWIESDNLWIRRSAIIFQLKWKGDTDEDRLYRYCLQQVSDPDFFIRKAIGWALREYGKTNPSSVLSFLKKHEKSLSPLSLKEAKKRLSISH